MTQDALDDHIRHAQAVEITSQAAAASVPAVPLRKLRISLVIVARLCVIVFRFAANFAAILRWKDFSLRQMAR